VKLGSRVQYRTVHGIVTGIVVGMQHTDSQIYDPDTARSWPGIRFEVRDEVTNERLWTATYPDKEVTG